mgnify:CR=1 FL=1
MLPAVCEPVHLHLHRRLPEQMERRRLVPDGTVPLLQRAEPPARRTLPCGLPRTLFCGQVLTLRTFSWDTVTLRPSRVPPWHREGAQADPDRRHHQRDADGVHALDGVRPLTLAHQTFRTDPESRTDSLRP